MSLSLRFESHNFRNSKEEEESMRLNTSFLEVAPRLSSQKMRDFSHLKYRDFRLRRDSQTHSSTRLRIECFHVCLQVFERFVPGVVCVCV